MDTKMLIRGNAISLSFRKTGKIQRDGANKSQNDNEEWSALKRTGTAPSTATDNSTGNGGE